MEAILIILTVGALNVVCFFIGAKVGQTVSRGEDIKLPANPVEAVKERNEKREAEFAAEREAAKLDAILRNIESYDGTARGQEDIPRG